MTTLTETQIDVLRVLAERRDRGMAIASFNHLPENDEHDACIATSTLRVFIREGLATPPLTIRMSRRAYITNGGVALLATIEGDDLDPIDADDEGEFSAEFVAPIVDDGTDWDIDRWSEMAR